MWVQLQCYIGTDGGNLRPLFGKIRMRTAFYWLIVITMITWALSMLYVYSWRDSWAGKNADDAAARIEENYLRQKIASLEFMAAPENDILDQRLKLAKRLLQSDKFMAARDVLEDGEFGLSKSESFSRQEILLKQAELNRLEAICFRNANADLFSLAAAKYAKAAKVLATAPRSGDIELEQISLLNDQAVLQYLWANSSKAQAQRILHFAAAEKLFQKCVTECRFHLKMESMTSTRGTDLRLRYRTLVKISADNWIELLRDQNRFGEIASIVKLTDETLQP